MARPGKCYPNYDNPAQSFCIARFSSAARACQNGTPSPSEGEYAPEPPAEPGEGEQPDTCVTFGPNTFCMDANQPNCGTLNGQPYCNGETDKCGTVNGQFMCIPKSGSRTCSYSNGEYVCIDPTTDTKIPSTSADHPNNGGNADGNPHNDEQAPDSVTPGGGAQGTGQGATNKSITDLQAAMEKGFDSVTDLLSQENPGATNKLEAPAEKGTYDLQEWDDKLDGAKTELKQVVDDFKDLLNGFNNWFISGSGGGLPCIPHEFGELCISDYESQLIGIRYVLLFVAAVLAVYIIFVRD